ncbi:tRNA (cmo5U34)-methyltransferase [Panacagrimonas perspica]|uniref:tRNA (Cmo5U34)-methyltransferase n=1 Tax=Panacagrimonas perspica TaxID=381431 RepID=A0A4R7NWM1_9GAMM|nr:class I SAM-dependent methyltransferase [Panacagrimonas perspica]TDU25625.1 tRNA (cmo5U34)-methyltransferase [Panacagrimonas perspica]THD03780.1 SAM-dependent methyltransferase [Panacagrimonas perspica]
MSGTAGGVGEPVAFDAEHAARYDERFAALAPITQALHLLIRSLLADLPARARILCVGAGTGAEMMALAPLFPSWHFTAVDPSAPMLAVCRRKAEDAGFASRCTFHEGYLDSLSTPADFDAATCVLVSQFLLERNARVGLFRQIASRLRPGGWLINADLSADLDAERGVALIEQWIGLMRASGLGDAELQRLRTAYRRDVAVVAPAQIESMLAEAGFRHTIPIHQALLIHAWASRTLVSP